MRNNSVITVLEFTLSVGSGRFFRKKTAVVDSWFDEWVSLLLRELLGMGNSDKGGHVTGPQSEENN